jgi:hypothetical protein
MSLADEMNDRTFAEVDAQLRKEKHDAVLLNLIDAAKPFLVDNIVRSVDAMSLVPDAKDVLPDVYQCIHCGAFADKEESIEHHAGCVGETLRKAIKAAEADAGIGE